MADLYASEARKSLNRQFYMNRADLTSKIVEEPGRSDLLVLKNGRGCAVEIKHCYASFKYSEWRDNQREWAKKYCIDTFKVDYWIWLIAGDSPPAQYHQIPNIVEKKGNHPRQSWLVPYPEFVAVGEYLKEFSQDTIPYLATKGYNKAMQEHKFDLWHVLQVHSLNWVKGAGYWHIPETHTFYKFFHWRENK